MGRRGRVGRRRRQRRRRRRRPVRRAADFRRVVVQPLAAVHHSSREPERDRRRLVDAAARGRHRRRGWRRGWCRGSRAREWSRVAAVDRKSVGSIDRGPARRRPRPRPRSVALQAAGSAPETASKGRVMTSRTPERASRAAATGESEVPPARAQVRARRSSVSPPRDRAGVDRVAVVVAVVVATADSQSFK
eukprot:30935-Pelagococcus_subviridis.AAC.1